MCATMTLTLHPPGCAAEPHPRPVALGRWRAGAEFEAELERLQELQNAREAEPGNKDLYAEADQLEKKLTEYVIAHRQALLEDKLPSIYADIQRRNGITVPYMVSCRHMSCPPTRRLHLTGVSLLVAASMLS